jgi:hypothetical protein
MEAKRFVIVGSSWRPMVRREDKPETMITKSAKTTRRGWRKNRVSIAVTP